MGIRSRRKTKHQKTEVCIGGEEELISKLPDDILVHVLSRLAPKEIIRCGVLSQRWTALPKLVPMALKFVRKYEKGRRIKETEFIHQVNQVLDSYPGDTLTELSIYFPSCMVDQRSQFDKWIQFAMAKNVRKFSLDLSGFMGRYSSPKYRFPQKRLISRDVGLPWCTSLTDLRLVCIKVTSKQIKHFLECCPFLESLCVISSDRLTSLKVDGHIRLKFLEIQDCNELQILEISAPNLISFKYAQCPMKSMPLKSAPQLNEMLLSGYDFLIDNFHLFTSYFDQIVTLSLVVREPFKSSQPEFRWPIGIPTLRNLKNLTVHHNSLFNESLLCFGSWIEASPLLRRFVFEKKGCMLYQGREAVKPWMCPHQLLKEVEFVGFNGDILDTELVMYIIENAVNLNKMVFDCRSPAINQDIPCDDLESKRRELAIVRARNFKSILSPSVMFVLIS